MTNQTSEPKPPIVLIHGLWMTPRSWENWGARYEGYGYKVLAPPYPGFEVEVEAFRAEPSPIEERTIDGVAGHLEEIVRGLDTPPILMGHSFVGTLTQLPLDRGLGAAAVVIDSALVRGIRRIPISQIRFLFTALDNLRTDTRPSPSHRTSSTTPSPTF